MKPDAWQKLSSVLDQVLDLPIPDRDRFLDRLRDE
jgi:hypothetical protein